MRKRTVLVLMAMQVLILSSCRDQTAKTVVAYVSEDRFSRNPVLKDFERDTGITVKSVFDTEEAKSPPRRGKTVDYAD